MRAFFYYILWPVDNYLMWAILCVLLWIGLTYAFVRSGKRWAQVTAGVVLGFGLMPFLNVYSELLVMSYPVYAGIIAGYLVSGFIEGIIFSIVGAYLSGLARKFTAKYWTST